MTGLGRKGAGVMKTSLRIALTALVTLTSFACDSEESDYEPIALEPDDALTLLSTADEQAAVSLTCPLNEQATKGGLYYPGWTCAAATANAEANLSSWHYRSACNQQVGSDIASPALDAEVSNCIIDSGSAVISVDLCCDPPATVAGVPQGTRKMCISGGTQAQMQAECELKAQNNVDRYTNGTWSTQDYINHWTDPCPAGTSIVPNSQFYVAGSCNGLPNVGPDCYGPGTGSYNWEMQIGVMCQ